MKTDRKHYTPEFKSKVVLELLREDEDSVSVGVRVRDVV